MTDGEKLLLDDAIDTAIKAERRRLRIKAFLFLVIGIASAEAAVIVGGLIVWGGSY